MIVLVEPTGRIVAVHSDDLADLIDAGTSTTRRASHVEPGPAGRWTADLGPVGGPVLQGPTGDGFRLRSEALAAERRYLEAAIRVGIVGGAS